jgi:hypothetical protein
MYKVQVAGVGSIGMCSSSSNLVMVHWFLTKLSLLNLEENWNFQFPLSNFCLDWLIDYLLFNVLLKNISLIWKHHHYQWTIAKFRPMAPEQGGISYRATPTATCDLGFPGLIRRIAPLSRLLRHTRECGGFILTWILWMHSKIQIACVGSS